MIKMQVYYTTINGEKKSKIYSYINPESSDVTIKDFANALFNLSTNTTGDIYKIDTAILLDDDSDDIVTPIVTSKVSPQLSLSANTLSLIYGEGTNHSSDVTVTRLGDGVISTAFIDGTDCATTSISDTTITFTGSLEGTGNYRVSVAESNDYFAESTTLTVNVDSGGAVEIPSPPSGGGDDDEVEAVLLTTDASDDYSYLYNSFSDGENSAGDVFSFADHYLDIEVDDYESLVEPLFFELPDSFDSSVPLQIAYQDADPDTTYIVAYLPLDGAGESARYLSVGDTADQWYTATNVSAGSGTITFTASQLDHLSDSAVCIVVIQAPQE